MPYDRRSFLWETCSGLLEALDPILHRMSEGVAEDLLRRCLERLAHSIESGDASQQISDDRIEQTLRSVHALADEQINNIDFYLVPARWLALYTDVSLARAVHRLWSNDGVKDVKRASATALEAVRLLDMALIVSGGSGVGRLDWIHGTIHCAQRYISTTVSDRDRFTQYSRPTKRRRIAERTMLFAPNPVPILSSPPAVSMYTARYRGSPFVLRKFTTSGSACPPWAAISKWSDPAYILARVGEGRHVPVEIGSAYSDRDWGQRIVQLRDFLAQAGFFGTEEGDSELRSEDPPMYLAQHSLFRQFPQLEADITLPDYVWSAPSAPVEYPAYAPPSNEEGVVTNVWIGSGSGKIVSPAHTDPYFNCFAQVLGAKRVWLAPPSCGPYMSPHSRTSDESQESELAGQSDLAAAYMSNTSTYPLLRDGYDSAKLMEEHPSFAEHVWPHAMETILYPGDLLVMPPGWWHAMRGEGKGPGWSISMWY